MVKGERAEPAVHHAGGGMAPGILWREEQCFQVVEIHCCNIRDRAKRESTGLPGQPLIALHGARAAPRALGRGFFHEHVDDVFAAPVDEGSDGAALDDVESPAEQRESRGGKISHRRRKIQAAIEPGFYGVLVGGFDVGEVSRLQGAEMRIHQRGSDESRVGESA